jgi:hypothetical protein
MDFLHTFALLPQSVYSTDMRDSTLSHIGGDLYGTFSLGKHVGKFSYTAYGGDQRQSIYGGYPYLLTIHGVYIKNSGGPTFGGDLRWITPVKGLLTGASYEKNDVLNTGLLNPSIALGGPNVFVPYTEWSKDQFAQQFYGEYAKATCAWMRNFGISGATSPFSTASSRQRPIRTPGMGRHPIGSQSGSNSAGTILTTKSIGL